jgi:hypothetical protein
VISKEDIANQQAECASMHWHYRSLAAGHDVMITAPEELADLLQELV